MLGKVFDFYVTEITGKSIKAGKGLARQKYPSHSIDVLPVLNLLYS